jgi:hypothetical protein
LTLPDPQLIGAWYPGCFNPLHLSRENPVSKRAFQIPTCTAYSEGRGKRDREPAAADKVGRCTLESS